MRGSTNGRKAVHSRLPSATEMGEVALRGIALRTNDHDRLDEADAAQPPVGRHGLGDLRDLRHQNAIVDIVAIAESFTSNRLRALVPTVTDREVYTWKGRLKAWRRHASIDITTCKAWEALSGFVEVRNALQHGLGRLTESQLAHRNEVLNAIARSGTGLEGDLVRLTGRQVADCSTRCLEFISWLDMAASTSKTR